MPELDRNVFKAIGKMGTEETGYPCIAIFDDFAYDKKKALKGGLLDWIYEQRGAYPFATELWSLAGKAGIELKDFIGFFKDRPPETDAAMLKVLDDELGGEGYKPWTPFEHPQLGPVEIGGWDTTFTWQNPPGPMLEEVTGPNAKFVLRAMATAPMVEIRDAKAEPLGGDVYLVSAIVQNTGFLPTYVSEQGKKTGVNGAVKARARARQRRRDRLRQAGAATRPFRWAREPVRRPLVGRRLWDRVAGQGRVDRPPAGRHGQAHRRRAQGRDEVRGDRSQVAALVLPT